MADSISAVKPVRASTEAREKALAGLLDGTLYYFSIFFPIFLSLVLFIDYFYTPDPSARDLGYTILYWSKLFWFTGAMVVATNVAGLLYFGSPLRRTEEVVRRYRGWNTDYELVLSYVSRGDNVRALVRALSQSAEALWEAGARYRIEIVTDKPVEERVAAEMPSIPITYFVVPQGYETARGAKYKARALQYLNEHRAKPPRGVCSWILHLDEESAVTPSSIAGAHAFITHPANVRAIGQGEIKYNAYRYGRNLFITALDSIRSGDDLGRFRLQYALFGMPLFGMHGSFILLPQSVEEEVGFDTGGRGSITEDAYFALIAQSRGVRFGWVDGFIREQSPFTIRDVLRQRRRWFCGLRTLSFDGAIKLHYRIVLMINTLLWSAAWAGPVVTTVNIMLGGSYFPLPLTYAAALIQGGYGAIYLIGAYRNLVDTNFSYWRKAFLYAMALVLLPVSSALEGVGVLYALLFPLRAFDVVKK